MKTWPSTGRDSYKSPCATATSNRNGCKASGGVSCLSCACTWACVHGKRQQSVRREWNEEESGRRQRKRRAEENKKKEEHRSCASALPATITDNAHPMFMEMRENYEKISTARPGRATDQTGSKPSQTTLRPPNLHR